MDCSATWWQQQTWGATISDWEFGYKSQEHYLIYTIISVVFIVLLIPILVKVGLTIHAFKFLKKKVNKPGQPEKVVKLSITELFGFYFCCWLTCWKNSPELISSGIKKKETAPKLQFKSDFMKSLEKQNFSLDKSLDLNYLNGTVDNSNRDLLGKDRVQVDYFDDKDLENHSFGENYYNQAAKETLKGDWDKDPNMSDSLNTESLKSGIYDDIRKGIIWTVTL